MMEQLESQLTIDVTDETTGGSGTIVLNSVERVHAASTSLTRST